MQDRSIDYSGETPPAPLTPDRAFVLQLRGGASFAAAALGGRIEHVTSGRACLFRSLEEARAFMEQVLAQGERAE